MANANLSIGQVNVTQHLLVIMREVSNPTIEVSRQAFAPPHPTSRNIVFTGLNPTTHYVDFRESPDGVTLGTLHATFTFDVKNNIFLSERRFYLVDGERAEDPAGGSTVLTDPYLSGKTIGGVFQEGFRYLVPPEHPTLSKEYDINPDGGILLLGGNSFSPSQVWSIDIVYNANQTLGGGGGLYNGVITLTGDITLDSTHYNKRLRCESTSSARQVVSLPPIGSVPDGTTFYFMSNGGNQYQTKIKTNSGEVIKFFDTTESELTISKGEFLYLEKRDGKWEMIMSHHGLMTVGERIAAGFTNHPNTMPEDGRLLDGDDYPRIWWWIKTRLPATHYITDDTVINGGYVHPASRVGQFVVHSTQKKFRMPNTQGMWERGLKSFTALGTDTARPYDFPGGFQDQAILEHTHSVMAESTDDQGSGAMVGGSDDNFNDGTVTSGVNSAPVANEQRVKNIGVIYLRRI